MADLITDEETTLTIAHERVVAELERRGISIRSEFDFPPYRVDCYLDDYHAAVEVDGPWHSPRAAAARDAALWQAYHLPVFHIVTRESRRTWLPVLLEWLSRVSLDSAERKEAAELEAPWL